MARLDRAVVEQTWVSEIYSLGREMALRLTVAAQIRKELKASASLTFLGQNSSHPVGLARSPGGLGSCVGLAAVGLGRSHPSGISLFKPVGIY